MIEITRGNLLETNVEALVNTVNCVGYMGKGIALQFKKAYPDNNTAYEKACRAKLVVPGKMFIFETGRFVNPKFIINFPTKRHYANPSRLEDIAAGLTTLIAEIRQRGIRSVAVPPLGCGLGGLDWSVVRPLIERAFAELPSVQVAMFEPVGAPDAKSMPVGTTRQELTLARALFIKLMGQYGELAYRLTLLEIQKLAYFLQIAGQPLKLNYEKASYGPYAKNLNKVLERMEGHYIRGYGDSQAPDVEIELLPGADAAADILVEANPETRPRLERVQRLIEGFETPYGMELLASIHWVASDSTAPARSAQEAIAMVHAWNHRKAAMFRPDHIAVGWKRLSSEGWIPIHN